MRGTSKLTSVLMMGLFAASVSFSQTSADKAGGFRIRGHVLGEIGILPGSTVTLKNLTTGKYKSVLADECGRFSFTDLAPLNDYEVMAKNGAASSIRVRTWFPGFFRRTEEVLILRVPGLMGQWGCATGSEHCSEEPKPSEQPK